MYDHGILESRAKEFDETHVAQASPKECNETYRVQASPKECDETYRVQASPKECYETYILEPSFDLNFLTKFAMPSRGHQKTKACSGL